MSQENQGETPSSITLRAAIAWAGSQGKLAKLCGCSQMCIYSALKRRRVTAELALAVERASAALFKREHFRPDLFCQQAAE